MGKMRDWFSKTFFEKSLMPVDGQRGWIPLIQESYLGAFQEDVVISLSTALSHPTVYACITQIAADIGKLQLRLIKEQDGIWLPTRNASFSPVLRKPNHFQTRQKFIECWLISKLSHGNTYVLKVRDKRGIVVGLYVLDPTRVEPLVAEDGSVFYRARQDALCQVADGIIPAAEIIHDTMECLFHPLVGVPPLYAGNLATSQGLEMQRNSANFFKNGSRPGGILTAPGTIKKETAERLKEDWYTKYGGKNAGKVAVLGDGLKYEPLGVNAKDSNMVEQLKWSDEKICSVYKVPAYKVNVGAMPTYQQSETLDRKYYSDCLQRHIESIESLLDEGLSLPARYGTEFDLEDLLRMDFSLKMDTAVKGVGGGIYSPNEARKKFNLGSVKGGDTPYLQQQNYSLEALNERDKNDPFPKKPDAAPKVPDEQDSDSEEEDVEPEDGEEDQTDKALHLLFRKSLSEEIDSDEN